MRRLKYTEAEHSNEERNTGAVYAEKIYLLIV